MAVMEGREPRGRPGPSLTTWCKVRAGGRGRHHHHHHHHHCRHDSPRDARRALNAILRTSRRLGVRAEDLGRLRGAQGLLQEAAGRTPPAASPGRRSRKPLAHDPDFLAAGILFALMIAVLAAVLAAMLVADAERAGDLPGNKSVGGGALRSRRPSAADVPAVPTAAVDAADAADAADVRGADVHEDDDTDPVPAYLLELLQNHRNRQHLEEDMYHDDYRERYDGFDQPPPFRQRHVRHAAKPRAVRAVDLEISEEEAFSTRVFVTTPRRQR